MKRSYFEEWLFYVLAWTLLTLAFSFATLVTMRYFINFFELNHILESNKLAEYMVSDYQILEGIIFGVSFGTFFFIINLIIDTTDIHKMPFGTVIFLKSLMYTIAVIIVFLIVYFIISIINIYPFPKLDQETLLEMVTPELIFFFATFFVFATILINFLSQINKKFGPGNLLNMFLGIYHRPRIEDRIFLFIDLKDSTAIAEKLGHIKYSRLIQSFFMDLNYILPRYRGEIYQYVGDEAVITWRKRIGLKNLKCVRFYYAFKNRIERRSGYYNRKYDCVPEFKAGINMGEVTAAEIGVLKREIAYHGDVINTASRIQELCNDFGKSLLATEAIVKFLPQKEFEVQLLGEKLLKGKKHLEKIFSIG